MKLLLTSAGIKNKTIANALLELARKPAGEINIAFIPTAMNPARSDKNWFIDNLYELKQQKYKMVDIVDISALPKWNWQARLEAADVLIFSGGVSPHLMKWVNESGLKDLLPEFLKTKVYVGISAGSIVMSPTLKLGSETHRLFYKEKFGYDINEGLGYIDFYIRPHLNSSKQPESQKEFLTNFAQNFPKTIYAIDDQMAIKVLDGKAEVVGEGEYLVFNK